MKTSGIIFGVIAIALLGLFGSSIYTVKETDTVILTQFGRTIGAPVSEPGLHFKMPFVQTVNRIEKRVLEWDGPSNEMPTKDKTYVEVDAFARWKVGDATAYFVGLRDERSAQSRLDDIIGSEIRTAVAKHELLEIIRSDKTRKMTVDPQAKSASGLVTVLPTVQRGRLEIESDILRESAPKLKPLGIELLDVRIKRVNYNGQVLRRIFERMISERQQIAQRFRSEGEGESARIKGRSARDLNEVESAAYKLVQQLQGEADAEATRIYAEAYNKSPQAAEFYGFLKTMETYKKVLGGTNLVLSTDSEFFHLLKKAQAPAK